MALPPGPKGHFLAGNLRAFNNDTLAFLVDMRRYGGLTTFWFGPFPAYAVNAPETIHQVLVEQASKFYKSRMTREVMYPLVGNGLFTSDGEFWKGQRKLIQPVFHAKRIADYADLMVQFADEMVNGWQNGQTRDIDHDMTGLTMRIIAKALFDATVTSETSEVGQAITRAFHLVERNFRRIVPIPRWMPGKFNREMDEAVRVLDGIIQSFIVERRRTGEDKGDFLSLLLAARNDDNKGMTDKQLRDEAMTLFGAGHETTAVTMMWAWYLLSQNPAAEAKLHAELDTVLGGRPPTLADLANLPYTEMVIKETMRLYPAAWAITRQAVEDATIDGHTIRRGSAVVINIYGMHRDPAVFPNPDAFEPERFAPEKEEALPKYAYIPFGGGPRICIGNAFALMEARLLLATIAQRYHLDLDPSQVVKPERLFSLRSKYGMKMIVKARVPEQTAVPQ